MKAKTVGFALVATDTRTCEDCDRPTVGHLVNRPAGGKREQVYLCEGCLIAHRERVAAGERVPPRRGRAPGSKNRRPVESADPRVGERVEQLAAMYAAAEAVGVAAARAAGLPTTAGEVDKPASWYAAPAGV